MPRLKCGVDSCIYWRDRLCVRQGIHVIGSRAHSESETACDSYFKKDRDYREFDVEIGTFGVDMHLRVDCEALNCKFNENHECFAHEIKIDGSRARRTQDTFCSSFELK
jgi:hypothetical protein